MFVGRSQQSTGQPWQQARVIVGGSRPICSQMADTYIRSLTAKAIETLEQAHLPCLLGVSYVGSFRGLSLKLDSPHLKHFRSPIRNSNSFTFRDPLPTLNHLDYTMYPKDTQEFLKHLRHS